MSPFDHFYSTPICPLCWISRLATSCRNWKQVWNTACTGAHILCRTGVSQLEKIKLQQDVACSDVCMLGRSLCDFESPLECVRNGSGRFKNKSYSFIDIAVNFKLLHCCHRSLKAYGHRHLIFYSLELFPMWTSGSQPDGIVIFWTCGT